MFSLPPDTKMFQFSGFASRLLGISRLQRDGFPHSDIRGYNGYLLLPAAYRSLSRPSSPLRAKAFAMRPFLLFSNIILLISLLLPICQRTLSISDCGFVIADLKSEIQNPNRAKRARRSQFRNQNIINEVFQAEMFDCGLRI